MTKVFWEDNFTVRLAGKKEGANIEISRKRDIGNRADNKWRGASEQKACVVLPIHTCGYIYFVHMSVCRYVSTRMSVSLISNTGICKIIKFWQYAGS